MKNLLISTFALLLPFIALSQQTINGSITHDGIQRDYILYVPANYNGSTAVPLVFNFHGYTSNANEQMWYGDFRAIADTAGFLIVHPMGTLDGQGTTHFNVGWGGSTTDDIGFSGALLDSIAIDYNINSDRVYSTGMSNGGFMSYYLACQLSDKIAAIASVTGSMSPLQYNGCNPQHPTPVLEIHGTSDGTVPYNGATWTKPISDVVQYWVDFNNTNTTPTTINIPDINSTDGSTVEHFIYNGGDNDVTVEHFKITGGAHTWPGTAFGSAGTNYDIDASVEIWKFFMRFDINGLIGGPTSITEVNSADVSVYPNPTLDKVNIQFDGVEELSYELYSPLGILIKSGIVNESHQEIDLTNISANIYFLIVGGQSFKVLKQ